MFIKWGYVFKMAEIPRASEGFMDYFSILEAAICIECCSHECLFLLPFDSVV